MNTLLSAIGNILIQTAHAQNVWQQYYGVFGGSGSGQSFIIHVAERAANFFLSMVTGGAILAIMWGGIRMATSAGNEEAKETAKKTIQFGLLGAVLAVMAMAIIAFTANFFVAFSSI